MALNAEDVCAYIYIYTRGCGIMKRIAKAMMVWWGATYSKRYSGP